MFLLEKYQMKFISDLPEKYSFFTGRFIHSLKAKKSIYGSRIKDLSLLVAFCSVPSSQAYLQVTHVGARKKVYSIKVNFPENNKTQNLQK